MIDGRLICNGQSIMFVVIFIEIIDGHLMLKEQIMIVNRFWMKTLRMLIQHDQGSNDLHLETNECVWTSTIAEWLSYKNHHVSVKTQWFSFNITKFR